MKNYRRRKSFILIGFIILLTSISFLTNLGCSFQNNTYIVDIIIENQTDQVLIIYEDSISDPGDINHCYKIGEVKPGENIVFRVSDAVYNYPVFAVNEEGEIVFSKTLSLYSLPRVDEVHEGVKWVYKAIIPPLGNGLENSDNVTTGNATAK